MWILIIDGEDKRVPGDKGHLTPAGSIAKGASQGNPCALEQGLHGRKRDPARGLSDAVPKVKT